jgi:3-oxoacyl-[acyl-carrier protein] reductase
MNELSLEGRHAIVTGAAGGIGQAIVRELLEAGAAVSAFDRDASVAALRQATTDIGGALGTEVVDCGSTSAVDAAVHAARSARGPIDIVVHGAGIGVHQSLADFDDTFYDRTFDVHVRGLFALTRAVHPDWQAGDGGAILAVTSPAALRGQDHGGVYAAAKSAVIGFVRSAALELAPLSVRANAILPMAATPMTSIVRSDPDLDARYLERVPLRRWGTPEEIARFCRFVVSDAGSYITGAVLPIDGGRSI